MKINELRTGVLGYKIQNAYALPYERVINEKEMKILEKTNKTIASSRLYLICKLKRKGVFKRRLSKPEVLYVGETFKKENRFGGHKKLLEATTIGESKNMLMVYFLHMRFQYVGLNRFDNDPLDLFNSVKDINNKTSIRLMERFFIKLFNPILNKQHVKKQVSTDRLINEMLIDKKVEYVTLDLGMNEYHFNFVGGHRVENEDWYNFNLNIDELTYGHPILNSTH